LLPQFNGIKPSPRVLLEAPRPQTARSDGRQLSGRYAVKNNISELESRLFRSLSRNIKEKKIAFLLIVPVVGVLLYIYLLFAKPKKSGIK